jgi:phospholipid-binding lipoprotein MlaA
MKRYLVLLLIVITLSGQDDFVDFANFTDFSDFEETPSNGLSSDPLSGYNRMMTGFNDGFHTYVLSPLNMGYVTIVHIKVRKSIDNFFNNLYFPMRFINNILQGKFHNAFEETGRFVVNTTVGCLGFFDLARSEMKLLEHNEDFGQTLGFYGVGAGPHIVLPFLGPSNLRDTISMYPNTMANLLTFTSTQEEALAVKTMQQLNAYSLYRTQYEQIKENAVDLYPYLRDLYEQKRNKEIEE